MDRRKGKVTRNVFLCYVFGSTGAGKTSLLKALVNKPFSDTYSPTTKPYTVVNSVEIKGAEKYLVMQEFGSKYEAEVLHSKKKLEICDLLCLVYDSSDVNSFSYIAELRRKYDLDHIPSVFVATKSESDLVQQRYEVQPDVYCRNLGYAVPISVSVKAHQTADLYHMLTGVAMNPSIATLGSKNRNNSSQTVMRYLTVSAVVGTVLGVILYGYRYYRLHAPPGGGPGAR